MTGVASGGRTGPILGLAAALALGLGLLIVLTRPYPLERSAIGFDGLGIWLSREGIPVRRFEAAPDDPDGWNTLRILPIYDNDLGDTIPDWESEDETRRLGTLSPRDMSLSAFEERMLLSAETLVILPKWREGIVERGRAHPALLIPGDRLSFLHEGEEVVRRPEGEPFRRWDVRSTAGDAPGAVTLYAPQVLGATFEDTCEPVWQVADVGTLLGYCDGFSLGGASFYVLSDPDILDNHGLSLGDNAAVAVSMMRLLASGGSVLLDPGGEIAPQPRLEEDSFADPSRFFRYPFALVWIGVAAILLLSLWRGNVRFGLPAVRRPFRGFQSKRDTIRASGRLMRLAGDEEELTGAYARARMEALSDMLLGQGARSAPAGGADGAVIRFLHHRSPELGARMETAYRQIVSGEGGGRSSPDALAPFEAVFGEILDEFGRASRPSRRDRA